MNAREKYNEWLNHPKLEENLREELKAYSNDEIEDAFYQELSFGTAGIRGVLGAGTNRINIYAVRKATEGFARYLVKNKLMRGVAIGYDNRHFSLRFAKETAMVFASHGIKSYIYPDYRPTPMLSFAVRHLKLDGGVMITASHNPKNYNGYKVYNANGAQTNLSESAAIIHEVNQVTDVFSIKQVDDPNLIHYLDERIDDIYLETVKKISMNDSKKLVKIVYSPLHGTGAPVIPKILEAKGYKVYPYMPQMIKDPNFSNTKSSNPEEVLAYEGSIAYAKEIDADVIMLTDPDADRLGIAVKHQGEYVLINGNQTAAIEVHYILDTLKKQNRLPKNGYVYSTIVTSSLLKKIANRFDVHFVETLTGFKFIGEQALKIEGHGTYLFGCEESYGSLVKDFVRDKDAVQAVYLLSEIASVLYDKNKTIVDYLEEIYTIYGYHLEQTTSLNLTGLEGQAQILKIMDYFKAHPIDFKDIKRVIFEDYNERVRYTKEAKEAIELPKADVLKFIFEDSSWIALRPSGTEPKLKIYYGIQASTKKDAQEMLTYMTENINQTIRKLLEDKSC